MFVCQDDVHTMGSSRYSDFLVSAALLGLLALLWVDVRAIQLLKARKSLQHHVPVFLLRQVVADRIVGEERLNQLGAEVSELIDLSPVTDVVVAHKEDL